MSAREKILAAIRDSLGPRNDAAARVAVAARIENHARNVVPTRSDVEPARRVEMFVEQITGTHATVARVANESAVPAAVAAYLAQHNLPAAAVLAPDVAGLGWGNQPMLQTRTGVPVESDQVGVTGAFVAIAETGTLMLTSGPGSPITLNLLPDNHVVVLRRSQITGTLEDAWDALRASRGEGANAMPRTAMFVSGPSSTADIELTLYLGAHGPRRLHIVLIDE
ncbi:MAG: LUD domain-containing protein [Alphaproteobacteria bacterium]